MACWLILWAYWVFYSIGNKRTVYQPNRWGRVLMAALTALSYLLLYLPQLSVGFLGWRLFPRNDFASVAGLVLCVTGVAFAMWARRTINTNWSAMVALKEDHELVREGPYAIVRHPIYTGLLLSATGTAIVLGEVRGAACVVLMAAAFLWKISLEECLMRKQFSEAYPAYESRVKRLFPFLY